MARISLKQLIGLLASLCVLQGCGGGGGDDPVEVTLDARLTTRGTLVTCQSRKNVTISLDRQINEVVETSQLTCPIEELLSNDFRLSTWTARVPESAKAIHVLDPRFSTVLPEPVVYRSADQAIVLDANWIGEINAPLRLTEMNPNAGTIAASYSRAEAVSEPISPATADGQWQWIVEGAEEFGSRRVAAREFARVDTDFWGALAVGDLSGSGTSQLAGTANPGLESPLAQRPNGYATNGLAALTENRTFRDVRVVDLDNDGLGDVVANVYGEGCAIVGMRRTDGEYEFSTPLRQDGSCIGGHGETLLVADFDGDGLVDIFLPSYERFDYLKNLGGGQFVEMADALGISFPGYLPKVEGAAAVDLNLDGFVDIVVGNEVLLNDGNGGFIRQPPPYGTPLMFDEGLSVADIDQDGVFDIVKHDPSRGSKIFWGNADRVTFTPADDWLLGEEPSLLNSFGVAVGDLSGNGLMDIAMAGGAPEGTAPTLCFQGLPRRFLCSRQLVSIADGAWQDLLMVADIDADGHNELFVRERTITVLKTHQSPADALSIDLRDSQGHRNLQGHALVARCAADDSLVGLRTIDGGNGYMSQGNYVVSFESDWCMQLVVSTPIGGRLETIGTFSLGRHVAYLPD